MSSTRRPPYLPGLDGLRALAVIAVLLYHGDVAWLSGGYLGVELFFVISGFLITAGLLAEWRDTGRIDLPGFWLRRARRLLPAVFVLIIATLTICLFFLPDEIGRVRADALASFGYVTNWYLIFDHQSYFEWIGRPSLLRHLWSLAVEEQFYIVWPVLLAIGLRFMKPSRLIFATMLLAGGSALLMSILHQHGTDVSRLYYGTDTRASGLLVGAALALAWAPWSEEAELKGLRRLLLDGFGLGALAFLAMLFLRLDENQPFLYQGGFMVVAFTSALLIAIVSHQRSRLGALLGFAPLRWMGLRSYGIYLWHWPVFMLTRPEVDVSLDGLDLLALRVGLTLLIAQVSFKLIEQPVRHGALTRLREGFRRAQTDPSWSHCVALTAGTTLVAVLMGLLVGVTAANSSAPPSYLAVTQLHGVLVYPSPDTSQGSEANAAPPSKLVEAVAAATVESPAAVNEPSTPAAEPPTTAPPASAPASGSSIVSAQTDALASSASVVSAPAWQAPVNAQVTAIGDSVMLAAAGELARVFGAVDLDAMVGRQVGAALQLLRERRDAGALAPTMVIHIGNNGTFTASQFEQMMAILGSERQVIVANVNIPRAWEGSNNAMLASMSQRYANVTLVDWHALSSERPDFFWDDKIHLRPQGAAAYANLIASYVR